MKNIFKSIIQKSGKESPIQKKLVEALANGIAIEDAPHFDDNIFESMLNAHWDLSKTNGTSKPKLNIHCPIIKGRSRRKTVIDIVSKDLAFLVDSIAATINQHKMLIEFLSHPLLFVKYDASGNLSDVKTEPAEGYEPQSHIHIHVHDTLSNEATAALEKELYATIKDVYAANKDWKTMLAHLKNARNDLEMAKTNTSKTIMEEYCSFLDYLHDNNFTLLGYAEYAFSGSEKSRKSNKVESLGLLKNGSCDCRIDEKDEGFPRNLQSTKPLSPIIISKTRISSTVHRRVPMDAIAIQMFDEKGNVVGEKLFLGLFTSVTYSRSINDIPFLRKKVQKILDLGDFGPESHDLRAMRHILEKYPRDELFQTDNKKLYTICSNILRLQERQRIALFTREDLLSGSISCLVYVPRERFGTYLRQQIVKKLEEELGGTCTSFFTSMDDSVFARGLFRISINRDKPPVYKADEIEEKLQALGQTWAEKLSYALEKTDFTEEKITHLILKYGAAFPVNYINLHTPTQAIYDIEKIEASLASHKLQLDLHKPGYMNDHELRLKIYNPGKPVILSDVLPILENMGLRSISELPYEITPENSEQTIWIHDFLLETPTNQKAIDIPAVKAVFEESFTRIWDDEMESDKLNKLVLTTQSPWRDIVILRTYVKYMRQGRAPFSQSYIQDALTKHADITKDLIALFHTKHDPEYKGNRQADSENLIKKIINHLKDVDSLNEDLIIRSLKNVIKATLRTNFYQTTPDGHHKPYISIKLDSKLIDFLPRPQPFREIFVYSTTVEGIHLRGDKIARGGLRWSDRHEDFRTEVLGLMKAQMVKNAVIVPMGSKGGFVVKIPTETREEFREAGIQCYKTFIRGLLDITDNLDGATAQIIPPKNVVRHDGDDPYLVVAADKGTATFSDIANSLSQEYGFWLDDAFASGGSAGYDHKIMGITARGGWESVKLHFRQLNHNTQTTPFDVIGVGDMGGDVFGNGMLQSEQISLVGAFNHLHIFCDPNPDTAKTFKERERLFKNVLGWDAYDQKLLSKGGRIFSRSEKSLELTPEIRERFDIEEKQVAPSVLMQAMLKARTDLLWFGGIGTYMKAKTENDAEVGDKANDAIRINGEECRASVIAEGANLGVTQLGRIEFSKKGGKINTDFIDNSGGVDSSDHEVNIKILLSAVMKSKKHNMDLKKRNILLSQMTKDVENHVLRHNYQQAQAVSLAEMQAAQNISIHDEFIQDLERKEVLSRKIEFLPDTEEIQKRTRAGKGLTRPELAILISYSKLELTKELLTTTIPDDPDMQMWLFNYFPEVLRGQYKAEITTHKLRREIIAMTIANSVVNRLGPTFVKSTMRTTGMSVANIIKAYMITREVLDLRKMWDEIENLDNQAPATVQLRAMLEMAKLSEFSIHWFLTRHGKDFKIADDIKAYHTSINDIRKNLNTLVKGNLKDGLKTRTDNYKQDGLTPELAESIASLPILTSTLDITQIANREKNDIKQIAATYFELGERFQIDWLRQQARFRDTKNNWDKEATAGLIEKLYACQAGLTMRILNDCKTYKPKLGEEVKTWIENHSHLVDQLTPFFDKLHNAGVLDLAMLVIAEQRLRNLYGG
jgi:glutamate dehydrogenase